MLEARFLGQYDIRLDDQLVVIPSRPAQSLFAYLLLSPGRANRRERLAGLFWPDSSEANARSNLRQALWRIRRALGTAADLRLESDDLSVSYLPQPGDWLDVDTLDGNPGEEASADELIRVVSAYEGELLPGFYEEWVVLERERLQATYERKIGKLLDHLLAEQRWNEVLEWGERWIATGSIAEPAYRALMGAYAGLGDLAGAAAQYQRCVEVLSHEFGVEPSERTRQVFEQIREPGLLEDPGLQQASFIGKPAVRVANPYKGLLAFRESDAENFFGREALTARLVKRLGEAGEARRFLAVVGPSGSGKSSLVKAGLIPALRQDALPGSGDWLIAEMFPGFHPFEELEISLRRIAAQPFPDLMEQLRRDNHGLLRAARLALPSDEVIFLLVIDQFEEIFTLVEDKAETKEFLESLCVAVTAPRSPLRVVITLRADFFDRLLLNPNLSGLVQNRTEVVIPLTLNEIERAIRLPAERAGVTIEPELVAAMVDDMVEQPGALPLLQYALSEIFEQRKNHRLTMEAYQAIGGVRGVLESRAEETYAGLSQAGQAAVRQMFLRLVTIGEGVEAGGLSTPDTRLRVLRSELETVGLKSMVIASDSTSQENQRSAAITEVIDAFGKARLLYFNRDALAHSPTVEIAHEALLSEWRRLGRWLDEGRGDMRMQRALGGAAAEWVEAEKDPSFLLRGTRLSLFENWVGEAGLVLTGQERTFLNASLAEREAQQIAEAARLKREAELTEQARQQARLATARELAAMAINNLGIDPERSILLSLQAIRTMDTREAENALHSSILASRLRMTLTGFAGGARTVDYSPDGTLLAVATFEGQVSVWDASSGQKLFSLPGSPGRVARFSPDGTRLATGDNLGTVFIWDLASQNELLALRGHTQQILDVQFSPDGKLLSSTSSDETFVVWDAKTGQEEFTEQAQVFDWDPLNDVRFSPDGKFLISSNMLTMEKVPLGNEIRIWAVGDNWVLVNRQLSQDLVDLSPDGRWLVSTPEQSTGARRISLWDLSGTDLGSMDLTISQPFVLPRVHSNFMTTYSFNQDGSLLVTTSLDATAKVWRTSKQGLELLMTLYGHTSSVNNAAFSPDGGWLATSSEDGTVRIWDISPKGTSEWFALSGHTGNIRGLAITKDGKYLATASADNFAKVWDLEAEKLLVNIQGSTGLGNYLFGIDFNPDENLLVTAGSDNIANIWKLTYPPGKPAAELQLSLTGHTRGTPIGSATGFNGLLSAVFSPDGARLATGGEDGMAKIWDVKNGQELLSIRAHPDPRGITRLAFSPDGKYLATTTDGPEPLAKVWDAASGIELSTFKGQTRAERIWGLAFSPDGARLATGAYGGSLKIWDAKTGVELLGLTGHTSTVVSVAFNPDGKYLASVSGGDGTLRIWDLSSGEMLQVFTNPSGTFHNVTFTPDGKRLIAAGLDTIYGYILDRNELVRLAESRLTRGFTPEECRQYLHQEECPAS